jgi:hypothetical protein
MATFGPQIPQQSAETFDEELIKNNYEKSSSREKIRNIISGIKQADKHLKEKYPILKYQDAIGFTILVSCVLFQIWMGYLFFMDQFRWFAIPLIAFSTSLLHELEHDLIHNLYFFKRKNLHTLSMGIIWLCKASTNPWWRRDVHLKHHKESGQITDIEERLIGLGLTPLYFWVRIIIGIHPIFAWRLIRIIKKEATEFRSYMMALRNVYPIATYTFGWAALLFPHLFSPKLLQIGLATAYLIVLPGVIRTISLHLMTGFSHYYGDISKGDVFFQNQILDHPLLFPFQLFCANFGATHVVHH